MKLGFVSAILPELSLTSIMTLASEIGYDCVEVMCWPKGVAERRYAGVTHIDIAKLNEYNIDEIHQLVTKTGIDISGLGYYPNPLTPDDEEAKNSTDHIKSLILAAKSLGVKNVNTFIGRDWTRSVDENWPRFEKTWKPLIALAEESDIRIGIENCPMFFTNDEWPGGKNLAFSPAIWSRMFDAIPSDHFGLNFDPSHLIWLHIDYDQALLDFADKIFHVHAKDVRLDQNRLNQVGILANPLEYHQPKLPGMGDVHWGRFFSILTDTGYDGAVCVEVEDRAYEVSLERRKAALIQSQRYLHQFVV